jgi:hypothetical protein
MYFAKRLAFINILEMTLKPEVQCRGRHWLVKETL